MKLKSATKNTLFTAKIAKVEREHGYFKNGKKRTSCQDGGVGRYTLPPCTTKRRTITNLKTKHNQNCQKIKMYGNPTTKELKNKHSFRLVGGAEMDSQAGEDGGPVGGWWLAFP